MSKRTIPSVSSCCVKMVGSAPKSIEDIIRILTESGLTQFYMIVGVRATLGWHDELSGSKSVFVDTEPFGVKPSSKIFYSTITTGGKYGCIDQSFWVQCQLYYDGNSLTVVNGVFDCKLKRTIGIVVKQPLVLDQVV